MIEIKLPTETIELPSKGLLYDKESPLSSGKIEINYPRAKEEDILSNINYIKDGSVFDKYYKSIIVGDINLDEMLVGDKNALMIGSRILAYGKNYSFTYNGIEETVDLSELKEKEIDLSLLEQGKNEFAFTLPHLKIPITFKLLTSGDEKKIQKELEGLQKINPKSNPSITTRFKYIITSIDGDYSPPSIRQFVDKYLISQDKKALIDYIELINPDIDLTFFSQRGDGKKPIPFNSKFIWG